MSVMLYPCMGARFTRCLISISIPHHLMLLLLFAMTRSVVKSVKVSVVEVANARIDPTGFRHRSSGDKSVGCVVQSNRCLTSCGVAPQSVHLSLGSPNTLCL